MDGTENQNNLGDLLTTHLPSREILMSGKNQNHDDLAGATENRVVIGKCSHCGRHQPAIQNGHAVIPLADDGCAACNSQDFGVAEKEEERSTPSIPDL